MLPHSTDRQSAAHHAKTRTMRAWQKNRTAGVSVWRAEIKSMPVIWRPWVLTSREVGKQQEKPGSGRLGSSDKQMSRATLGFQHPVRSKAKEYLSHLGWKVLASFPVQATLHFYNDDSSSESEDEKTEEEDEMEEV